MARIEAVRRRLDAAANRLTLNSIRIGDVFVDFKKHRVSLKGVDTYLTKIEWQLLSEFVHNLGCLLTYDQLLTRVWGPEYRDDTQLLRTWVSRLRSKIEVNASTALIRTMPKTGYIMERPPEV